MCSQANWQESKNTVTKSSALKGANHSEGDEVFQTVCSSEDCV